MFQDDLYLALANETRREILCMLKWKSLSAGEIADRFEISKPSISRHLEMLRKAQLISCERRGNKLIYSLNMSIVTELKMEIIKLLGKEEE